MTLPAPLPVPFISVNGQAQTTPHTVRSSNKTLVALDSQPWQRHRKIEQRSRHTFKKRVVYRATGDCRVRNSNALASMHRVVPRVDWERGTLRGSGLLLILVDSYTAARVHGARHRRCIFRLRPMIRYPHDPESRRAAKTAKKRPYRGITNKPFGQSES